MKKYKIDLSAYNDNALKVIANAVYKHAFYLGYLDYQEDTFAEHIVSPYIYLDEYGITIEDDYKLFVLNKNCLISFDGFLNLKKENNNLKPCPFCGNSVYIVENRLNGNNLIDYSIICSTCDIKFFSSLVRNQCIENWNRRI